MIRLTDILSNGDQRTSLNEVVDPTTILLGSFFFTLLAAPAGRMAFNSFKRTKKIAEKEKQLALKSGEIAIAQNAELVRRIYSKAIHDKKVRAAFSSYIKEPTDSKFDVYLQSLIDFSKNYPVFGEDLLDLISTQQDSTPSGADALYNHFRNIVDRWKRMSFKRQGWKPFNIEVRKSPPSIVIRGQKEDNKDDGFFVGNRQEGTKIKLEIISARDGSSYKAPTDFKVTSVKLPDSPKQKIETATVKYPIQWTGNPAEDLLKIKGIWLAILDTYK